MSIESLLDGILHFYSETGTEGGSWAFQDAQHIQKNVGYGYCKRCGISLIKQSGAIQLQRVYPLDEELLRTGELPERPNCPNNNHEEEFGDQWSYEGLHVLGDGDHLTIYNPQKKDEELWSGVIALQHYDSFTQAASGMWIHADQKSIDREVWAKYFFEKYPARLMPFGKIN